MASAVKFTALQWISLITGVMGVVMGLVYVGPEAFIRRPLPPGQTTLVVAVEALGPVWPVLYTLMGIGLILAVTARRFLLPAHAFAVLVWMFYGACVIIGSLQSQPPAPIITGVMSAFVALIHFGLLLAHQDAGDR